MNLQHRIDLLVQLGNYILSDEHALTEAKEKTSRNNAWFIPAFIDHSLQQICNAYLQKDLLSEWAKSYPITIDTNPATSKTIGIVMAGNIPLVGFHDLLCVFISGHRALIKVSSKDDILIRHLVEKLYKWDASVKDVIEFAERLKDCDAYIATGSNNSARYFDYYFAKYPHIIRRNRTAAAVLTGDETSVELELLADDVYLYFGLGCRNVTKLYVPSDYDFVSLLNAFRKYDWLADHNKYRNNYDYNLAIYMLNKKYYMTNNSILLIEDPALFSPVSQLNYEVYEDPKIISGLLLNHPDLQCVVGKGYTPFGKAQYPGLGDYADGVDTLKFLTEL